MAKVSKNEGRISFSKGGLITIFLNEQPDEYNAVNFQSNRGVDFILKEKKDWVQISLVKSLKARLFDDADSATSRKGYLVKEDLVKIIAFKKSGWVEVEYSRPGFSDKSIRAYIREETLYKKETTLGSS